MSISVSAAAALCIFSTLLSDFSSQTSLLEKSLIPLDNEGKFPLNLIITLQLNEKFKPFCSEAFWHLLSVKILAIN